MGKNTMIKKAIQGHLDANPSLEKFGFLKHSKSSIIWLLLSLNFRLLNHIKGNVGFVFTREDLVEVREKILANKVKAPAKAGALAPLDVKIPPQNTGLGPEKTSFFQALQIPTKISKGTIEILNEIHLIKKDEKVGASEATLLNMLNISPFTYGLKILQVYDSGTTFNPEVLDITPEDLKSKFLEGIRNITIISLEIGYPTVASVSHSIINGLKNLISVSLETDYTFKESEMAKEYLKNPSKFAAAAAPAATTATADASAKEEKKEEKKEESEEDSGDDMGFSLFD